MLYEKPATQHPGPLVFYLYRNEPRAGSLVLAALIILIDDCNWIIKQMIHSERMCALYNPEVKVLKRLFFENIFANMAECGILAFIFEYGQDIQQQRCGVGVNHIMSH